MKRKECGDSMCRIIFKESGAEEKKDVTRNQCRGKERWMGVFRMRSGFTGDGGEPTKGLLLNRS